MWGCGEEIGGWGVKLREEEEMCGGLGVWFMFQGEDGIREGVRSRVLGEVYKGQGLGFRV